MQAWWAVVAATAVYLLVKRLAGRKYHLPPGPPGKPLLGNLLDIDNSAPHLTITKWSEEYGDIFRMTLKREPGKPQCVMDELFDHQQKGNETNAALCLTDEDIYGINTNLIFAGTFTTSTTINCLIAVLINQPAIQHKMAKEIETKLAGRPPCLADRNSLHYIEAAILETLRYSSIICLNVPHVTMVDTTLKGYDIPRGTEVLFNLWKLHHNTEYWDEPWEFRPERYLDENGAVVPPDHINRKRLLAFGASRRVCIGESLAKNRLFLMVTSLLQHFEFLPASPTELPRHDPRDYKISFGIEPHRYRLKLVPRQ